jgi:HK97 gp10 family phage protein
LVGGGWLALSDDDLDDYLQSLPDKIVAEISDAIKAQAERLSDAQKRALQSLEAAPEESGDLEKSCRVEAGDNELEFVVKAGGDLTTKEVRGGSGVGFDYALAFEYGTSRQHAKPFFWNTYAALRDDMQAEINDAIEKALNE